MAVDLDMRKLTRLRASIDELGEEVAKTAAELMQMDIKEHWSASSPSSPGRPPAIDTGLLDDSIIVEKSAYDRAYRVVVKAGVSYPSGTPVRKVGDYLEYGTTRMAPRPFFTPASERLKKEYPQLAAQKAKLLISKAVR